MLKLVIAKLDEVEEGVRGFYEEKDGKYHLKLEGGVKTQADIDKVLAAKNKEVAEHNATKTKLKDAEAKLTAFGETDPDKLAEQLQELETLKAAGPNANAETIQAKAAEIAERTLKTERQKFARDLTKVTAERDDAVKTSAELGASITQREISDQIRGAATTAKVIPESVADLLIIAGRDFKLVDGKAVTEDGRTPDQWVEDSKKTRPFYWPVAKGAGAGGANDPNAMAAKDNPFSHEGWNMTKQGNIVKEFPDKANTLAKQAGTTVGGPRPAKAA